MIPAIILFALTYVLMLAFFVPTYLLVVFFYGKQTIFSKQKNYTLNFNSTHTN